MFDFVVQVVVKRSSTTPLGVRCDGRTFVFGAKGNSPILLTPTNHKVKGEKKDEYADTDTRRTKTCPLE